MLSALTIKRATNKAKRTNSMVTIMDRKLAVTYFFYPNGKITQLR
jgi:hypothetical protein